MNKTLLVLLCFCCQMVFAQTNDYKITYKQFLSYGDKLQRDAVLYVKENQPTVMHTLMASTVVLKEKERPKLPEPTNGSTVIIRSGAEKGKPFDYSVFPDNYMKVDQQSNKNVAIDYIGTKRGFIVKDDQLKYTWKITSETKKIKDYTCYKATTTFRGNNFEAWFTPDIPINAGPWKWYGLPGLIVEVHDVEKKEIYLLEKVEKLTEEIPFPSEKLKTTTLKDFVIEKDDFFGNPLGGTLGRDTTVTSNYKRGGLEKVYEWEEETKKQ
ncbi:GLPGLI family protein [Flavobacterium sp. xlx-214]|uniref:GLPGLI family protein n=1 Tax=unclassified Flavobacterium TaxID=196869 RepID=UPI0013D3254E|nr:MULTISPECIES: GLPGLI family protein [unclassified Flavobacterium]MBA5791900.1 GLPGLI family protein [Flavobacterium sp. xlx-221]QMI83133.1 GLPGLI family protein [Flavobacterium sp. xlx-214]